MPAPQRLRRLAGDAVNTKDGVATPINQQDLVKAVAQLQDTVNQILDAQTGGAAPNGTVRTAKNLFTPAP